jgi:hypothetical protein
MPLSARPCSEVHGPMVENNPNSSLSKAEAKGAPKVSSAKSVLAIIGLVLGALALVTTATGARFGLNSCRYTTQTDTRYQGPTPTPTYTGGSASPDASTPTAVQPPVNEPSSSTTPSLRIVERKTIEKSDCPPNSPTSGLPLALLVGALALATPWLLAASTNLEISIPGFSLKSTREKIEEAIDKNLSSYSKLPPPEAPPEQKPPDPQGAQTGQSNGPTAPG